MPSEVILFGGSGLALTVLATLVATLLLRWRNRPLPSFASETGPASGLRRLFSW